jgi:NADPH-dependent ferric siderophore reductase
MNAQESVWVDLVCRWMVGDPDIDAGEAYLSAGQLAERALEQLDHPGVSRAMLLHASRHADSPFGAHTLLAELLADCWAIEESGPYWPAGEVRDLVIAKLTTYGFDITHPATALGGTRDGWDIAELRRYALEAARRDTAEVIVNVVTHAEPSSAERGNPG